VGEEVPTQQGHKIGEAQSIRLRKVVPTGKTHGAALTSGLAYEFGEAVAIHQRKKLAE